LIYILVLLVVIFGGLAAYIYFSQDEEFDKVSQSSGDGASDSKTLTSDDFTLEYRYSGNNTWKYSVTGVLPSPCYKATVEAVVRESYPEQVTVNLTTSSPEPDTVCVQMVLNYSEEGEFEASEKATVDFNIVNK